MSFDDDDPDEGLHSNPAELALIATVGQHWDALAPVLASLPGKDFYRLERGVVWDACRALSADGQPCDPITVSRWLVTHGQWGSSGEHGDVQRVVQREMGSGPALTAPGFASRYSEQVAEYARRREVVRLGQHLAQVARSHVGDASDALALMRSRLDDVEQVSGRRDDDPLDWEALIDEFENVHAPGGSRPGIPSPWFELDDIIGGLFGGRVYVLGGRPGAGKSTAALVMAQYAAVEHGKQCLIISKEMPSVDVTGRFLAAGAEVELKKINSRTIDDYDMGRIRSYIKKVGTLPITVDASPRTLGGIKALARAHHHRHGLDILAVDYVQLVRTDTPSRTREQEVAEVSRQMKELALELDCAVLLPAQLNRGSEQRADKRPTMSDLRDSGQIEQDADAVILLWRPTNPDGSPSGTVCLIVDKNRHGPTAEVTLRWRGGYGAIG
jgi:replicative DNA helicase